MLKRLSKNCSETVSFSRKLNFWDISSSSDFRPWRNKNRPKKLLWSRNVYLPLISSKIRRGLVCTASREKKVDRYKISSRLWWVLPLFVETSRFHPLGNTVMLHAKFSKLFCSVIFFRTYTALHNGTRCGNNFS